jgi:hypothetical protein
VSDNKETFIVIEDPTLNDLDLNIISSDKAISTKRDSSHGVNGRGDTALAGGSNKLCNLPLIGETSIWSSNPNRILTGDGIIEKDSSNTLNDLDLNIISSDEAISTKRDSSHLELPTVAVEESNRSRVLHNNKCLLVITHLRLLRC